ncbi:hypothetical protein SAY87_029404 [Trapa incisa]|uniref:Uncharacterized protein n=1 Tax=Trapa incisa TaxID=236973 RepID=A0AAN7K6E5_9MYRT|nr:hypothetical protein SAY87_029404 [Trapa incisa]
MPHMWGDSDSTFFKWERLTGLESDRFSSDQVADPFWKELEEPSAQRKEVGGGREGQELLAKAVGQGSA